MSNAPCLGCKDRHTGCHGTCEEYIAYQKSRKSHNYCVAKKRNEDLDVDDFRLRNVHKLRKGK